MFFIEDLDAKVKADQIALLYIYFLYLLLYIINKFLRTKVYTMDNKIKTQNKIIHVLTKIIFLKNIIKFLFIGVVVTWVNAYDNIYYFFIFSYYIFGVKDYVLLQELKIMLSFISIYSLIMWFSELWCFLKIYMLILVMIFSECICKKYFDLK